TRRCSPRGTRRSCDASSPARRSSTEGRVVADVHELPHLELAVPEPVLVDLRERLTRTRLPNAIEGIGWEQGTDRDYLPTLLDHWRDEYDWRACEPRLTAHREHVIEVDGQRIH